MPDAELVISNKNGSLTFIKPHIKNIVDGYNNFARIGGAEVNAIGFCRLLERELVNTPTSETINFRRRSKIIFLEDDGALEDIVTKGPNTKSEMSALDTVVCN